MTSAFIYSFSEMKRRSEGSDGRWEEKGKGRVMGKTLPALQRRGETVVERRASLYMFCCQCVV